MTDLRTLPALALTLLCAPLFSSLIVRTKAVMAGRTGAPLLQPWFDILKGLRKGTVYSTSGTWITQASPLIGTAAVLMAALLMPGGPFRPLVSFEGSLFVLLALFALQRFFMLIAALDTASAFEGMGASREALFAFLAEPVLFIGLATLARQSSSSSLASLFGASHPVTLIPAVLIGACFFIVLLAENCRIPFDDPTTHLELTMIHEVMVLDLSGPDLALITYTASLKLWLFSALVVHSLLGASISQTGVRSIVIFAGAMAGIAVLIGLIESTMARIRLVRVPHLLCGAGALALIAFIFSSRGGVL